MPKKRVKKQLTPIPLNTKTIKAMIYFHIKILYEMDWMDIEGGWLVLNVKI